MLVKLKRHWFLFAELVKRDFKKRYKYTTIGVCRSVLMPLLTLLVAKIVFERFFGCGMQHYTTYLFCGILPFCWFSEASGAGMRNMSGDSAIFAKANVPEYLLPFSVNIPALFSFVLTLCVFFVFCVLDHTAFSWRSSLLVYPFATLLVFNMGVGMILSTFYRFFRDLDYLWSVFLQLLMCGSAIFYTIDKLPAKVQFAFACNPLYRHIAYFREVVLYGSVPSLETHLTLAGIAIAAFAVGAWMYRSSARRPLVEYDSSPVLSCRNVSILGKAWELNVSFSLNRGDILGVIGTDGAGKSTLLKGISGIVEPYDGQIVRRGTMSAMLEPGYGFDEDLTVKENACLRGAMFGYTRDFMDKTCKDIIDFAGLKQFEDRPFNQLSSGTKSRLAFAIAMLVKPEILVLDEGLDMGDGAFRKKIETKIREMAKDNTTTILVSHSTEQVCALCNKVLWLDNGRQIAFTDDVEGVCDCYEEYLKNMDAKPDYDSVAAKSRIGARATEKARLEAEARQVKIDAEKLSRVRVLLNDHAEGL